VAAFRAIASSLALLLTGCAVTAPVTQGPVPTAPSTAPAPASGPLVARAPAAKPAPSAIEPAAKAAAKVAPKAAPKAQAAPAAGAPPLDLKSLEQKLTDTPAIGVMTKLTLRNQVNDLLDQFRAYYAGRLKTSLAELRQPYELLLMKVLSLLQDGDPALAKAIHASREAIWGILSDPQKFAQAA
jgi:hypothetical protein